MKGKIDDLGRLVVSKEMRKELNINSGDELKITIEGNGIFVAKTGCIFCGKSHAAVYHLGVQVCEFCIDRLSKNAAK